MQAEKELRKFAYLARKKARANKKVKVTSVQKEKPHVEVGLNFHCTVVQNPVLIKPEYHFHHCEFEPLEIERDRF